MGENSSSETRIYICPNCGTVYSSASPCVCKKCNTSMIQTPFSVDQWMRISVSDRQALIKKYMRNKAESSYTNDDEDDSYEHHTDPFWNDLLRGAAYGMLIIGIISSIILGITLLQSKMMLLGIVIILFGTVLSALSAACIIVYLDMAKDVSTIAQIMKNSKKQ